MIIIWGLIAFVLGALGWTFTEYAMHNWVGHKGKGKNEFSREHLKHHSKGDYFAPAHRKVAAAAAVLSAQFAVVGLIAGWLAGGMFTFGFGLAYVGYEWLHRRLHTHGPINGYGRWARLHHFHHHFGNPKMNHGVTTPIWDWVFRTYEPVESVNVPVPLAMEWLCDPETGDVKPAFAQEYTLSHRKSRKQRALPPIDTVQPKLA
jgi:sterol desaturase/sphingolipid hydroxylase (fatty acid hydroxylase superfamily)